MGRDPWAQAARLRTAPRFPRTATDRLPLRAADLRFETSIGIDAPVERVWPVLVDVEAWPQRIETVDAVTLLTRPPLAVGSRVELAQPKLPVGTWVVTAWEPPTFFEWTQRAGGVTSVAGHRVEALADGRSRLALTLEMRGLLIPIMGRFYRDLVNRYMGLEAQGMKRAAEAR